MPLGSIPHGIGLTCVKGCCSQRLRSRLDHKTHCNSHLSLLDHSSWAKASSHLLKTRPSWVSFVETYIHDEQRRPIKSVWVSHLEVSPPATVKLSHDCKLWPLYWLQHHERWTGATQLNCRQGHDLHKPKNGIYCFKPLGLEIICYTEQ